MQNVRGSVVATVLKYAAPPTPSKAVARVNHRFSDLPDWLRAVVTLPRLDYFCTIRDQRQIGFSFLEITNPCSHVPGGFLERCVQ